MKTNNVLFRSAGFLVLLLAMGSGCTSEDAAGEGAVSIAVSGGQAVRDGFPHSEGTSTYAFDDGWEIQFDRFIVTVDAFTLREAEGTATVAQLTGPFVVDLAAVPEAQAEIGLLTGVEALRHDVDFRIVRATSAATAQGVDPADLQTMIDDGVSVWISGTAVKGEATVPFSFPFTWQAQYSTCSNGFDGTRGLSVPRNSQVDTLVSFHVIHLFETALAIREGSSLRFDAIAAMAGEDGIVDLAELSAQSIQNPVDATGAPIMNGTRPLVYDDSGLLRPSEYNLAAYLNYASRNLLHFNGLGVCSATFIAE